MNYYRLTYPTDRSIGTTWPQSQDCVHEIHIDSPNHIWNLSGKKFPDDVYIPDCILSKKAKLTDLISSSPVPYPIISNKLKRIVEQYRTEKIQFIPTHLIVNGKKMDYWIMNCYNNEYECLDLESSVISLYDRKQKISSQNYFSSSDALKKAVEETVLPEYIWVDKIILLKNLKRHLIFFDRLKGDAHFFSETLKQEIEANNCTGIKFTLLE